jgi:hypothetical protein
LPECSRPVLLDPPSGLLVSANERIDGPNGERWISFPEARWRYDRLLARLLAHDRLDLDAILSSTYDEHDLGAETLLAVWAPLLPDDPDAHALVAWSKHQKGDDAGRMLGLYHGLRDACVRILLESCLGSKVTRRLLDDNSMLLINFEHSIDVALALERPEVLDAPELGAVLRRAWPIAKSALGTSPVPVRARFVNAYFEGKLPAFLGLDTPPMTVRGGPVAPFQCRAATIAGQSFLGGPAFHVLFDMSKRGGWYNASGGASERRFGPGYGGGLDAWHSGDLAPLGHPDGPAPRLRS